LLKKGWKIYDLETNVLFVSRDVIFHEDVFPYYNQEEKQAMRWQELDAPAHYEEDHELL